MSGRAKPLALALLVCALVFPALAGASQKVSFESVLPQFMCVSCHEPLELVSSPQAISEKQELQSLIDRGLSIGEIKTAMVGQYGPQVLAKPPASGFNLTVYILPPALFVLGLLLLAYTLPKWRRRARETTELDSADALDPSEESRLNAELDQFI